MRASTVTVFMFYCFTLIILRLHFAMRQQKWTRKSISVDPKDKEKRQKVKEREK